MLLIQFRLSFFLFFLTFITPAIAFGQKRVALVIGLNEYTKAGLSNLNYAESDASALKRVLGEQNFDVSLILGKNATKKNLENALGEFYQKLKDLKKQDVALLFLAGHGVLHQTPLTQNQKQGINRITQPYFCPSDANIQDPNSLIDINEIIDGISESGSNNNLLLIDACRDTIGRGGFGFNDGNANIPKNLSMIYAAEHGKASYESDLLKHGLFTHYLLEGLQGEAADKDGNIRFLGLANYVVNSLTKNSAKILGTANGGSPQIANPIMNSTGNALIGKVLYRGSTLSQSIDSIVKEIQDWHTEESRRMKASGNSAPKFRLGRFISETDADVNFEHGISETLRDKLSGLLGDSGDLGLDVIKGTYELAASTLHNGPIRPVLKFSLTVVGSDKQLKKTFEREVDRPEDITRVCGTSLVTAPDEKPSGKAIAILTSHKKPLVGTRDNSFTEIVHLDNPKMSIEVWKRSITSTDMLRPVDLRLVDNVPFIALNSGDTFEIRARNYDRIQPMLIKVFIDGLEVINAFSEDKLPYAGYVLPVCTSGTPVALSIPGWLRTTTRATDNVYRFSTVKLGDGSANEKKSLSSIGVITVEFYEPYDPTRGAGKTDLNTPDVEIVRGDLISVQMSTENFIPERSPSVTLSLRYKSSF